MAEAVVLLISFHYRVLGIGDEDDGDDGDDDDNDDDDKDDDYDGYGDDEDDNDDDCDDNDDDDDFEGHSYSRSQKLLIRWGGKESDHGIWFMDSSCIVADVILISCPGYFR